ncbi:MAG: co-chaperone GroES [Candidatus Buchananbacteria bacterium]
MTIKPIGYRVAVKPVKEEEITKSGIILPDTVKEKKAEGSIIALGTGEKVAGLGLAVGQKVLFSKYSGDDVEIDGEEIKIISCDDILAVIE